MRMKKRVSGSPRLSGSALRRVNPGTERLESRRALSVTRMQDSSGDVITTSAFDALVVHAETTRTSPFISSAATTIGPSGDSRIEALRSGYRWGTASLTYSFYAGGAYYGDESSPAVVSEAVKANVRYIFENIYKPVINMNFTEVPDTPSSYGVLRVLASTSASYAYAYVPTGGNTNNGTFMDVVGDVVLNPSNDVAGGDFNARNNSFQSGPGSHGFTALIHEIGHALGLKHPFDTDGSRITLPRAEDNPDNTVMTYTFVGSEPATLMPYDVLALQYFYGANVTTRTGDNTYAFAAVDDFSPGSGNTGAPKAPFDRMRQLLWDGGGTDTLDLSALPTIASGYRIDVQPGGWITTNSAYLSNTYSGSNRATDHGTRIPLSGTTIENVVVTRSSDSIFLNSAANRISGYTPGVATGSDVVTGSNQADTLDLSSFVESAVAKSQVGNDLVLNLGGTNGTVTVKEYYASPTDRIRILYSGDGGGGTTLSIAAAAADQSEGTSAGSTAFTFTVTRSGDLVGASTASWAVTGSGTNPANAADFTGAAFPTGIVSFAAGEATKTITINVAADATAEPDDGFTVTLSTPSGASLGTPSSAMGLIRNDDATALPTVAIAAAAADKSEGTGSSPTAFTFTVIRSGSTLGASSVSWSVAGSGADAANAADFAGSVLPSGTLSFAAGETSKTITVNVAADATPEADEEFSVTLSTPFGAVLGVPVSVTGRIRNDDQPSVFVNDVEVPEGTGGLTTASFMIELTSPLLHDVSIRYGTLNGTATIRDQDYRSASGTVVIPAGQTSVMVPVTILGDTRFENDERFTFRIISATGVAISRSSAVCTILNDDPLPLPTVTVTDVRLTEGQSAQKMFAFIVSLSERSPVEISVDYQTSDITATAGIDYVSTAGTLRFMPGVTKRSVSVWVKGDTTVEELEQFSLDLVSSTGATIGRGAGIGSILNDDRAAAARRTTATVFAALAAENSLAKPTGRRR